MLQRIFRKFETMRQRSKDKAAFLERIVEAAADGKLSAAEMQELQAGFAELQLTADDIRTVHVQAYKAALEAAKQDGAVTAEEEAELTNLQSFLRIPDDAIRHSKRELLRLRLLTEIAGGNLPTATVKNVILQKNETPHWSEPGSLLEERVVNRRYEGGSQGISLRIAKGVSYRVGAHRGRIITDRAVVPVSTGDLIVTDRRLIFRGDTKSFNLRFDRLLDLNMFADGIRVTDDKGKARTVQFAASGNGEIIGALLSAVINGSERG